MSVPDPALPNTVSFDLDGGVLLFVEPSGRLILLNETASSIWRGLESDMSVSDISKELADRTGCPLEQTTRDCAECIAQWNELGVLHGERPAVPSAERAAREDVVVARPAPAQAPGLTRSYRLLDLSFAVLTSHSADARAVDGLIGHLAVPGRAPVDLVLELVRVDHGYILRGNGEIVDECEDAAGLVPMLHANLLLAAYRSSERLMGLHAAAVCRGRHCVLMPGVSGSGKSTLAVALLESGFDYCTDDLVLLTDNPLQIRAFPMRVGLKTGSWRALATRWPEIDDLPVHRRADGQSIRYFLPHAYMSSRTHQSAHEPTHIVYPSYRANGAYDFRRIGSAEALMRLTQAGYDLPSRMDRKTVSTLVDWLSTIPCYSLSYSRLDQAVKTLSALSS